jgi:DMSO/TMAO reductase YedYZ molybdopterin-dependent catalytic subunit
VKVQLKSASPSRWLSRRQWHGALAGLTAGAVAIGVAELVSVLASPRATPLVAVGGVVIDHVPGPVKELAIRIFDVHDKQALLVGMSILLALIAAGIGVLATRRLWYGFLGVGLFGLLAVWAAMTRAGRELTWALPGLVGAIAGCAVLFGLLRLEPLGDDESMTRAEPAAKPAMKPPTTAAAAAGRRRFLQLAGVSIGAAAIVGAIGRSLSQRRNVGAARAGVVLPTPSGPLAVAPADAELSVPNLATYTTSNAAFYRIDTAISVPQVDPAGWTLRIRGRVARPMTLTFDDLLRRPMIERYITLACVSNEVGGHLIGNARWLGVPVKDLLDEAGPLPGADQVVSRSVDGFTAGSPTEVLRDGRDAMIAIAMNGEPLPVVHGFPARMVVPGLYGYVSATKWLAELELTSFTDYDAYWASTGDWAPKAPIKTQSRIDTPRHRATVAAGTVTVAGVAWAQHRGIAKVELRVDDDLWQEAELAGTVSIDTWRQWRWRWQATPGKHELQVRATDNTGETQTDALAAPAPDGATGWHTIEVTAI